MYRNRILYLETIFTAFFWVFYSINLKFLFWARPHYYDYERESAPAWTQEAYRLVCSKYSFCCSAFPGGGGGVSHPVLLGEGGIPISPDGGRAYWPDWGIPIGTGWGYPPSIRTRQAYSLPPPPPSGRMWVLPTIRQDVGTLLRPSQGVNRLKTLPSLILRMRAVIITDDGREISNPTLQS